VEAARAERATEDGSAAPLLPECLTEHTSCVIAKVGQAVARLIDAELEALGLRTRHYQVLKTLAAGTTASQQALGSALRIDGATMVSTIDDLEAADLVRRQRNDKDRRSYTVALTRAGRSTLAQADRLLERLDEAVLAEVPGEEQEPLRRSMRRLVRDAGLAGSLDEARARSAR
jgi:DNA-binding MarR family transcriptional regulator